MKKLLLSLLMLCACDDDVLVRDLHCGAPCAELDDVILIDNDAKAVTCHLGKIVCGKDEEVSCVGYALPKDREYCGGYIDDDCNSKTKEEDLVIPFYAAANTCSDDYVGVCAQAPMICIEGEYVCDLSSASEEKCDRIGRDEDCDGLVNNDDPSLVFSIPQFAYFGDPATANVGNCRVGIARCIDGEETYEGMVLPQSEVCGNRIDDDCDGLTDEPSTQLAPRSFLLALDYSGSMDMYIREVEQALCSWANTRPNDFFGIAAFGASGNSASYRQIIGFTTAVEACNAISSSSVMDTGSEYAAYSIIEYTRHNQWPTDEKNVIVFTDEEFQEFYEGEQEELIRECNRQGFSVGFYTVPYVEYTFDDIINGCNGWAEELVLSDNEMSESLTARFAGTCE